MSLKMTVSNSTDRELTISFEGKFDSLSAQEAQSFIVEKLEAAPGKSLVLNYKGLSLVTSAGLRVLMDLRRKYTKDISIQNASEAVSKVFEDTGLTQVFSLTKDMRTVSIDNLKKIGQGANGEVFRLSQDTIIKVFYPRIRLSEIEREQRISRSVILADLPAVIPYDKVRVEDGRYGIIFELLGEKTLSETIAEDPSAFEPLMKQYLQLLKDIHSTEGDPSVFPLTKDIYQGFLDECVDWYTPEELQALRDLIDSVPDRGVMLHGDYHPNNLMVLRDELIMIDLGDFSIGHPVFDFLTTAATQVNLVEMNPDYAEIHTRMPREYIRKGWRYLFDGYFADRTGADRSRIESQIRLMSKLKASFCPAIAKGVPDEVMQASVNDAKQNLIPRIPELIGAIDW